MPTWTLNEVEGAFRRSWGRDTCDEHDLPQWRADNRARGQCGVTALVLRELVGGDLVFGDVLSAGVRIGGHWWNRLPGGLDVDLTREQFHPHEVVTDGEIVAVPPGPPVRCREQYELLRARVRTQLGLS